MERHDMMNDVVESCLNPVTETLTVLSHEDYLRNSWRKDEKQPKAAPTSNGLVLMELLVSQI